MKPKFCLFEDFEELSQFNAKTIKGFDRFIATTGWTLGTSTGSTFERTYSLLKGKLNNLLAVQQQDFYAGNMEYQNEIWERVVSQQQNDLEYRWTYWDGNPTTAKASVEIHENNWKRSQKYPMLQLLGIGVEGHIGFCEAEDIGTDPEIGVHTVALSDSTIKANSRFYSGCTEQVPTHAITSGIKNLLNDTSSILFSASGKKKAKAVYDAFFGPITRKCPASFLQLYTGDIIISVDSEAAEFIPKYVF